MLKIANHSITMTELTFSKLPAKSGKGYLAWIPKHIVEFLKLSEKSYVEVSVRNLKKKDVLKFTKRVAKSGRGFLLWIPKDVSDYLLINERTMCELTIRKLGDKR